MPLCESQGRAQEGGVKRPGEQRDFLELQCASPPAPRSPSFSLPHSPAGLQARPQREMVRGRCVDPSLRAPLLSHGSHLRPAAQGLVSACFGQWAPPPAPTAPLALAAPWERRKQHLTCVAYSKTK